MCPISVMCRSAVFWCFFQFLYEECTLPLPFEDASTLGFDCLFFFMRSILCLRLRRDVDHQQYRALSFYGLGAEVPHGFSTVRILHPSVDLWMSGLVLVNEGVSCRIWRSHGGLYQMSRRPADMYMRSEVVELVKVLTPRERRSFCYRWKGCSYTEVGRRMGFSRQRAAKLGIETERKVMQYHSRIVARRLSEGVIPKRDCVIR